MANYYRSHYGYHGRPAYWGGHVMGHVHGFGHGFGHGFPGHAWGRHYAGHGWGGRGFGRAFGRYGYGRRWPWLGSGGSDQSPDMTWVEQCLAQLFGPAALQNPQQAIQQFQAQQQLPPTGVLDDNTAAALQAACSGQSGLNPNAAGAPQTTPQVQADPTAQAAQPVSPELGENFEYDVLPGRTSWPHPFPFWGDADQRILHELFTRCIRDENCLTDAIFYARHPELKCKPLPAGRSTPEMERLKEEWKYLRAIVGARIPGEMVGQHLDDSGLLPEMEFSPEYSPESSPEYSPESPRHRGHSGRWVRHNGRITVLGL